jgi:hypothetical protein
VRYGQGNDGLCAYAPFRATLRSGSTARLGQRQTPLGRMPAVRNLNLFRGKPGDVAFFRSQKGEGGAENNLFASMAPNALTFCLSD